MRTCFATASLASRNFPDLGNSTKIYSGGNGSGADVTLRGLIRADQENGGGDYVGLPIVNSTNNDVALINVKGMKDGVKCLFYVGSKGNKFLTVNGEKVAKDVQLVPIEDKDFNDVTMTDSNGNEISVWTPVEMPSDTYENLMPSGLFGNKSLSTIGVDAHFILSDAWSTANPDAYATIGLGIDDVSNIVRTDKGLELVEKD
jgi:hypothetical protein